MRECIIKKVWYNKFKLIKNKKFSFLDLSYICYLGIAMIADSILKNIDKFGYWNLGNTKRYIRHNT